VASEPKQARSIETRHQLIKAAAEILSETGPGDFTTTAVVQRAGKSQGALFRVFSTKIEIIAAAANQLLHDLIIQYEKTTADDRDLNTVIRTTWNLYRSDAMCSIYELYLMAHRNPELRILLVPILSKHRARLLDVARQSFPSDIAQHPQFERVIRSVLMIFQGAAVASRVSEPQFEEQLLHSVQEFIATEFRMPSGK
jgi:AcrR family transcriptional regulator